MIGVVLWTDESANKAVIWCEDQGDLAFCRQPVDDEAVPLDAGDLVQFDLAIDWHLRYAWNPRLVAGNYHPDLAERLAAQAVPAPRARKPGQPRKSAEIVPFRARTADRADKARKQEAAFPA